MANYVIKSVAGTTVFRALGIFSSFLINVVLARMLEPDILGQYFLAFSMAMFLSIIMRFGLKQTALKLVTKARLTGNPACITDTIRKILITVSISIVAVAVALLAGVGKWLGMEIFHSEEIARNLLIITLWASVLSLAPTIGECLRGLRMPEWGAALDNSVSNFLILAVFFVLFILGQSIAFQSALLISAGAVCLVAIVSFRKLVTHGLIFRSGLPCTTFREIYSNAYAVLLVHLSTFIMANASMWVVGYYLSHEDVAVYGVVLRLYNLIAVPLVVINLAIEPSIAEYLHENRKKHMDALLRLSATAALAATAVISAIIFIWGDWLLQILFGQGFTRGYTALIILVIGNLVNVCTGSCTSMMLLGGHQKILTLIGIIFGVASVALSIMLVSPYGMEGVAVAVSISISLYNIVTWQLVRNRMKYNTGATLDIKNRLFILGN